MSASRYVGLNLNKVSEPLIPTIWLKFRGTNYLFTFPDRTNKIYIENAEFNVLDENGVSSAKITLADPDFINLEKFFMIALFHANSSSREDLYWYVCVNWGWGFYGQNLYNPGDTDKEAAQYKMSGTHYYMLANLQYDANDTELRVSMELIDVGNSIFSGSAGSSKTVGRVSKDLEKTNIAKNFDDKNKLIDLEKETAFGESSVAKEVGEKETKLYDPTSSSSKTKVEQSTNYNNVFKGKNNWEILQEILKNQNPPIEVVVLTYDGEPTNPYEGYVTDPNETRRIPETASLKETIETLLREMPKIPSNETIEELKKQNKNIPVTKRWGILAGGIVEPGDNRMKMAFGWIPDPPTKEQEISIPKDFRLARIFSYPPGTINEILRDESVVLSLGYDWYTQGYWGLGFPRVYGIAKNKEGKIIVVANKDDWRAKEGEGYKLISKPPESGDASLLDIVNGTQGVKIDFNFDTENVSDEKITTIGNNIIINVWNYFLKELVDVNIEIIGDPFLDNRLFSRNTKEENDILKDYLVDLYHSYFLIKVYRLNKDGSRAVSPLFEGKYLCLKGCTHRISEGEYTTSLNLFKAF